MFPIVFSQQSSHPLIALLYSLPTLFLLPLIGLLLWTEPLQAHLLSSSAKMRHVYLTWQRDPCRTITINIHGIHTPPKLTVYYDTKPHFAKIFRYPNRASAAGHKKIQLQDGRKIYHIELTNLEPGTTYYFTIGSPFRSFSEEMQLRTIPDDHSPLLFVQGGDWENTPEAEVLAHQAASLSPYAVFLGGDYPSFVESADDFEKWDAWLDVYRRSMVTPEGDLIPMVLAIGNHEVVRGVNQPKYKAPFYFHYFCQGNTQESYFSLPFGKRVRLFVLDSGHVASHEGKQWEWLKKELVMAKEVPIKFAMYHVPLFPSIRFAQKDMAYRTFYGAVELWMGKLAADKLFSLESYKGRKYWLPLFDRYKLTACFEHHDQALKRTKPLRYGKEDSEGTIYFGDGGWGSEVQFFPIQGYFNSYFAALQGKVHFFWVIEIENGKVTYSAINSLGKVIDHSVQFPPESHSG